MMGRAPPRGLSSPTAGRTQPAAAAANSFSPQGYGRPGSALGAPPSSAGRLAMSHLASPPPASAYRAASASPTRPNRYSLGAASAAAAAAASAAAAPSRGGGFATRVTDPQGAETQWGSPLRETHLRVSKSPQRPASALSPGRITSPSFRPTANGIGGSSTTHSSTIRSAVHASFASTQQRTSAMRSPVRSPVRTQRQSSPAAASSGTSLLDSMSELRALIAKKELELSSLAQSRGTAASAASANTMPTSHAQSNTSANQLNNSSFYSTAVLSPQRLSSSPLAATVTGPSSSATAASLLSAHIQAHQVAQASHELNLREQELQEKDVRLMSLEQTLLEREEHFQELQAEAARLKKREEQAAADAEVRAHAHKKQVELLHSNLETLTWNRHDSLEKQREEFERLRADMAAEWAATEEAHQARTATMGQNLLNYEEQLRAQAAQIDDLRAQASREVDKFTVEIQKLETEVGSLRAARVSAKEQINSGIKQQLSMAGQLKSLSRKLEEAQRQLDLERADFLAQRQRMEVEALRVRGEMERKTEEMVMQLRSAEAAMLESERTSASKLQEAEESKQREVREYAAEIERLLDQLHAEKRALIDDFAAKSNEAASALAAAQSQSAAMERSMQEQQQRLLHEHALAQESWNKLVGEKERELQESKMDAMNQAQQVATSRTRNEALDAELTASKVECAQIGSDLRHAREQLDDVQVRLAELRALHKQETEQKALQFTARIDDLQLRLAKVERENDERERALVVERARTTELSAQLQLLRTASANKVRAIEVARTLEQQALLSDFASQLGRVRTEIGHIKAQPTPQDRARDRSRRRETEREKQQVERERSRERERERMNSPQPISLASMHAQAAHQQHHAQQASPRKHVRVRTIGAEEVFSPASPLSPMHMQHQQQQQQQQQQPSPVHQPIFAPEYASPFGQR